MIERAQSRYEEVYKPARDRIDEILKTDYTDEQLDDWDNRLAAQSEASPEVQAESSSSEQPQATPNVEATPQVQADTESATVTTGEVQTEAKRKLSPVAWSPLQALSLDDTPETATIPHRLFKKLEHLPQFAESLLAQAQSDDEAVHTKARNEIQTILKGNFTDEELEARARLFDAQNDGQSTVKPPNAKRDRILGAKRPAGLKGKRYPEDSVGRKLQRRLKDAYPHLSQHVDDLLEKAKNDEDARTELKAILAASDEVLAEMEQNLATQEEIQPTANVDETSNADETGETNDNRLPANVDESPSRESPSKRRLVKGRTGKIKRYSHGSKGFALHKKLQTEAHPNLREYADDLLERAAEGDEQARAEIDSVLDGYYSDELLDKWERILNPQEAEQSAEVQPGTRTEAQSETSAETQEETTPEAPKAEESKTSAEVQPETQSEPAPQEATEPESLSATEESSQTEAQTKPETESSQEGTTPQTQTQANEGASASTQEAESQRESTPESFKKFFTRNGKVVTLMGNPLEGKVSFNALLDALRKIAGDFDGFLTRSVEAIREFTFQETKEGIDEEYDHIYYSQADGIQHTEKRTRTKYETVATAVQNAKEFIEEAVQYLSDIATGKEPLPQEKPKATPKAKPQEDAKIENPYFAVVEKDGKYFIALKNKPFLSDAARNTLTAKLDGLALYKGTSTNSVAGGGGTAYTLKNGERAYSFNSKQDLRRFLFDATRRFLEPIEKGNLTFTEQATARKAQAVNEEIEALLNDEIERAAKADAEIQAKAKAEAQAKAEKEAQAKAEAEKKAQAKAEAEREAQAKAEKEADMSEKFFETEPANGETQVSFYLSDYPLKGKITDKDALGGYLQKRAAQIGGELDETDVENGTWIFTFNKEEDAQTFVADATKLLRTVADGKKPSLAREKLEDVQDFDELEDYFAEKHNATIDPEIKNFKYDGKEIPIDFEGVKEFLMGVEKAFALFPRFAGRINRISVGEVRDKKGEMSAVARFVPSKKNNRKGTRIILSAAHFTSRELNGTPIIAQVRDDLTNGYSNGKIATKTLEGAGAHEAGHYIQGLLMTKMGFRFFTNETFRVFADEFIKLIHKTSTDPSLYGEKRKRSIGSLTKEISQYATEKPSECIAEAVGDVIENGENAKPFSKVIVKAMKEAAQENDFIDINASFNRQQNSDKITIDKHTWRYKLIISQDFRKNSKTPFAVACKEALSPSTVWAWYKADRDRIMGTTKNRFPEITNKAERQAALDKMRKPLLDASRETAEVLLEDDNLSEALTGIREDETPESGEEFWEQSFQKQIPDEEIMASTDEWTPERIKEAAKNETLAQTLKEDGLIIDDDGNVSFQDERAKKDCIDHLKNIETIDLTLSEEWVDGRPPSHDIKNTVAVKDLNPFQRALREFAQKLGLTVKFFHGDPNFHGTHLRGISYINVDAKRSASFVFWHEFGHWLKNNQPELYKAIADSIEITQEQIDEKRDTRPDLSDDELRDEIIFDAFRNAAQREGLFKLIGKQDKNLLERFVSWAKAVLDRFTDWFRKPDRGLTTAQANQMQAAFGKMIRLLTDKHGKKIFRVNNNTHVIEHIDGRALHTWNLDAKAGYSFAGEKAKTAQKKHMKAALTKAIQMEENGASRQEIFDATGWFKGKDGKWRFEIVDDFEKIHLTPLDKRKKATLGEIYHNAALYKAYPPLAKMTVRVYSQADFENDNVKTAMGYYSTARKEIVLNPEYRYDWKEVLVHELQHAVQDIEGFAQGGSGKYAREILVTRGEDISGLSDRDLWFKLGGEQEAEEVRERAEARRKAKIKALSNADRVKAYGKLQKIKSEQSPEIQRLADEYEREIRSKGFTDSARQRKIEKKLPTELREAIVDVHFADVMAKNAVESSGDNVPTIHGEKVLLIYDGKTTSLSFAGKKAKTADRTAFNKARRMEKSGASKDEIFKATGWVKGKDGKWRFEIADDLSKINLKLLREKGSVTLGEIYDNPALYAAYPELKDMKVTTRFPGFLHSIFEVGHYNPTTKTISIEASWDSPIFGKMPYHALIHEIQHAIQHIEGFAWGGSNSTLKRVKNGLEQIEAEVERIRGGVDYFLALSGDKNTSDYSEHVKEAEQKVSENGKRRINKLVEQYHRFLDIVVKYNGRARELYEALGGEQEANEAANRAMVQMSFISDLLAKRKETFSMLYPHLPKKSRPAFFRYIFLKARSNQLRDAVRHSKDEVERQNLVDERENFLKQYGDEIDELYDNLDRDFGEVFVSQNGRNYTFRNLVSTSLRYNEDWSKHQEELKESRRTPQIHTDDAEIIFPNEIKSTVKSERNSLKTDGELVYEAVPQKSAKPPVNREEQSKAKEWTPERITEAAKNPQIFNGLTQHGAKLKDGKIVFPNKQARENAIKFLNAVTNPNFKFSIAWHGSPHQFDEFSLDAIGSGEGFQAHGWGLYFADERETSDGYRKNLGHPRLEVTIAGQRYTGNGLSWKDGNGRRVHLSPTLTVILSETSSLQRTLMEQQEAVSEEEGEFNDWGFEEEESVEEERGKLPTITYDMIHEHLEDQLSHPTGRYKAEDYKQALKLLEDSGSFEAETKIGSLFKVDIPDADVMLDEQETFDNQPTKVQTALKEIAKERGITLRDDMTGGAIYRAIANTLDSNRGEYSDREASLLLNKHGVKGIVYDGETDGLCYIVFDDKAIKILERESRVGPKGKVENPLRDDELTTVQKAIQKFCAQMGVPVTFFRSHSDTQGAFQNGEAFINVNSVATPEWVFHHEVGHWLAVNNPQLFNRLVEILDITPEQRDAYRKATKQPDLTDNQVDAEILCDKMGDIAQRLQLFKDVGKADASLVERLVAWFKAALDKFTDFFFKKENGLTRSQRDRLYGTFGKIVRAIVDEKGNRLFRYNNETHAIERADGTPLPQIALTEANAKEGVKYSFAGKKAKTASSSRIAAAELMERRGASKDEIFKATGFVRGRDGLWRFEIEDDLDKIDFNTLVFQNGNGVATLGEIYDNPKLYAAYPDLKSMTVTAFATDGKTVGEYLPVTNSIILNTKHTGKWKSALVHEIQHAIQEKEGFAKGGSPEQVFDQLIRNKTALEDAISKLPKNSKERKLFESMLESVQQGINDIITGRKTDDDLYWQLGGEQEAREVSDRAERRQISENPAYQGEIERSRKFAEESRRKLNGILANQSARVQSLTSEYWDALEQDEERAAELRKILPKDVRRAADTAFYAEEDANEWNDDGRGTPTIHDKNAIIALDKFGRSASSQTPPSQQQGNAAPKTQTTERNNPYAVDAKDNSTESLTQRIRNWLPAWLGGYGDLNAKGNRRIAQLIKRLIGYKLRFEHLGSNGDAEIDNLNKIIRSRRAYDWVNILPLVGAKLAHKLKLPATPEMANYIANWFLTGAPNDTSAQAKAFQKAARETPAMFELINAIRNEFKDVADASALDLIGREISYGENKKSLIEALPAWWHRFYEEWIDDLDPINRIVDGIKEQYGEDVAAEIEKGTDPYKKGRLYRGMGGLVDGLIIATPKANAETIRTVLRNKSPNLTFANFKPLAVILSSIGKGKKTFEDFNHYCVAKLVKEIHEHNRAHPEKQFPTRFTEEECDKAIEAAEKKYGQKFIAAQKDVVEFSRTILSMLYDAGVLTKEEYEKLLNKWKNYVPLLRIFEEEEDIDYDQLLHERKGSDGTDGSVIHAPILALVANAHVLVKRAERNKVKLSLANLARCGDFDSYVKEVDHKPGEPTRGRIVSFYENGVKKFLDTDPSVVRALNSLEIQSDGSWLMKMISAVTGFMRVNITARNVDFAGGNFIRDGADAYIHNKYYGWKALPFLGALDAFRLGLPSLIRKDANFYEWLARGGSQSALVSPDIDYTRRSIERIMGKRGIARKAIDSLQLLAEYSEYATRLGGYIRGKKELAKHRPNGKLTDADLNNAAFASREATVDFARAGRSGRKANKGLAFFNAGVQGLDMFARHFAPTLKKLDTEQGREELFGYLFRGVMSSVVLALIQFAVHHDDDWYEKGVADWEKENYWYLAEGLRIPKGFDFSIRFFSTLTDEILRAWVEDEPVKAKRFLDSIKDAAPTLTTTFVTPILEVVLNKKWFTNSYVVPQRLWKKSPERQYDANTSPLGIYFGEKFGTSPKNIDHLIGSYLGYMGTWSAKGFGFGSDELPLVRRFTFTPYKNSAVVSDFYDERNRQWKLHGDFKNTGKAPEGYDKALYSRLNRASKELSKIKDEEEAILWNKKLTSDQRQAKLQKLYKRRVAICEEALGRTQRAR